MSSILSDLENFDEKNSEMNCGSLSNSFISDILDLMVYIE